jgi:flagellar biosynthesis component FlhA
MKKQIRKRIVHEFGQQAEFVKFRDNVRLEKVRRKMNDSLIETTGAGSNNSNPD